MPNAFSNPPKGGVFKPDTQKTPKSRFAKDLSKRSAPMGNQGFSAPKASVAAGMSGKLAPTFPPYAGRR